MKEPIKRYPTNYPNDVSEAEWEFCAPYLTLMREDAPQRVSLGHAARYDFDVASGNWSGPSNWTPEGVPGSGDSVYFQSYDGEAYVTDSRSADYLQVDNRTTLMP